MKRIADAIVHALDEAGYSAQIVRREGEPESHRWPSDEFLVLIEVDSIYSWEGVLAETADVCRSLLKDRISFFMAPVRLECIVSSFAVQVITNIFPDDTIREWPNLPLALLDERATAECGRGLGALTEISGIIASVRGNELHDEEAEVLEAALQQAHETLQFFDELARETNHPLLAEISSALFELWQQVEDEAAAIEAGTPVERGLAASVISGLEGEANDIFSVYIGIITACVEYDIDAGGAWDRFRTHFKPKPAGLAADS